MQFMLFTWLKYISVSSKFNVIFYLLKIYLYSILVPENVHSFDSSISITAASAGISGTFSWWSRIFDLYAICFQATVCVCFVSTKLANKLLTVAAWSSKSAFSPELPLLHHKSYLFLWGLCCWCCWGHLIISVYFIVLHCFCVILESPWLSFFQLSFSSSLASFLGTALAVGFENVKENFIKRNIAFQFLE